MSWLLKVGAAIGGFFGFRLLKSRLMPWLIAGLVATHAAVGGAAWHYRGKLMGVEQANRVIDDMARVSNERTVLRRRARDVVIASERARAERLRARAEILSATVTALGEADDPTDCLSYEFGPDFVQQFRAAQAKTTD